MTDDRSWRSIADLWVDAYGEDELADAFHPGWGGNQLAGMELCERASSVLGGPVD